MDGLLLPDVRLSFGVHCVCCVCVFVVAKVVEVVIVGLRRSEALYWNRGLVSLRLGCVAFFVEGSPVRVSVKPVTRKTDGCELCDDN